MDKALGIQNSTMENVVLLASRLLLAWIFVHEGVFLATNFAAASAEHGQNRRSRARPRRDYRSTACRRHRNCGGRDRARLGAAALGLFCLATAILFHTSFAVRNELLHSRRTSPLPAACLC